MKLTDNDRYRVSEGQFKTVPRSVSGSCACLRILNADVYRWSLVCWHPSPSPSVHPRCHSLGATSVSFSFFFSLHPSPLFRYFSFALFSFFPSSFLFLPPFSSFPPSPYSSFSPSPSPSFSPSPYSSFLPPPPVFFPLHSSPFPTAPFSISSSCFLWHSPTSLSIRPVHQRGPWVPFRTRYGLR